MYIIRRIFRWISFAIIFFLVSSVSAVVVLKWLPVYYTPLMFIRVVEQVADGRKPKIEHEWVSIDRISENMPLAVVSSEDARFLKHNGFDFEEIYKARLQAFRGGKEWGASTISQQTAKNVFLWPGHSWVRKGFEAYFTVLIEFIWGKERIMEVYLNSVEMGDGIYGVKAVSRLNFDKNPDQLTRRDAALIAATLPSPLTRDSKNPSGELLRRRNRIVQEMKYIKHVPFGTPIE